MQDKKRMVVLLTGPSGVGKDTILRELVRLDTSLKWVPKYTNRLLRRSEQGRIHMPDAELEKMEKKGAVVVVKNKFGIKIAEPIFEIKRALDNGLTPVIDYNIADVAGFRQRIGANVFNVYVHPPSKKELKRRLVKAGRFERFQAGIDEITQIWDGKFKGEINLNVTNEEVEASAQLIANAIGALRR